MNKSTTQQGVTSDSDAVLNNPLLDEDDAADAFLNRWKDEGNESSPEPTEVTEETPEEPEQAEQEQEEAVEDDTSEEDAEDPEETDEEAEEETEEETEEDDEEGEKPPKKTLDDDAEVEIKVDDQVLKVPVKDLKRLYGQEAALTRKSQQVAAKRKEVEVTEQKLNASLTKLYEKAASRWEPYSKIDMLVASKQLDADQFAALRAEAQAAFDDFRFISEEADAYVKQSQAQQQEQLKAAAQEAVKVLKETIPGWSQGLYDQIRDYAVSTGLDADLVNNLVDPVAITLLHKARLYDESKKVVTKKKVMAPKKVVKSTVSPSVKDMTSSNKVAAEKRLRMSGDPEDAADVFLSRWQSE